MAHSISGLSSIADRYDGLILDLWGVIHDGSQLYPGVHHTLTELRRAGKKIVFLSNAPRRVHKVEAVLKQLGIEAALYDAVMSSGEVGYHWLASGKTGLGTRYYYIGPDKDLDVADGLDMTRVERLEEADFFLNVGFGSEAQSSNDWTSLFSTAQRMGAQGRGLAMVCLNPDLEVVKLTGERFACAGVLAHSYEELGGKVFWFGKPYPAVYEECMQLLSPLGKPRLLAVGDSLDTDIPGAQAFGIDSVLVTGGILKTHSLPEIERMCTARDLRPTYIVPRLVWQAT